MACQNLWTETFDDWASLDWIEGFTTGTYWVEEGWMEYDWVECQEGVTPVVEPAAPEGGPGGSNKAGKKKLRRGHIQTAPANPIQIPWGKSSELLLDLLPDDTPDEEVLTDIVEGLIVEQDLQVRTIEQLLRVVAEASAELEVLKEHEVKRAQVIKYEAQVKDNYKRLVKRRKEEEALIQILLHI